MKKKKIDWEQRRYEIVKEIIKGIASDYEEFEDITQSEIEHTAKNVLFLADALIKKLKKK